MFRNNSAKLLFLLAIVLTSIFATNNDEEEEDYDEFDDEDEMSQTNRTTSNVTLIFTKRLENLTIEPNLKVFRLVCEVQQILAYNNENQTEPKVQFKWVKNEAPIDKGKKVQLKSVKLKEKKWRSTLIIRNIDLFDRGFYNCSASNGIDRIRSSALIEVGGGGAASGRYYGSTLSSSKYEQVELPTTQKATKVFDANLLANPNQQLEAAIRNGQQTFDLTSTIDGIIEQQQDVYNFSEPFCQVYRGETCKTYLEDKYVFVQPPYTQKEIEGKLQSAFVVISQSNDISSNCNKFAQPSLCFSAFPLCIDPKQINTYQSNRRDKFRLYKKQTEFKLIRNELALSLQRICKDDCLMLENELCSKEYAIAKRHPVIGQTLELEECEYLPDETDASSKHCLSLQVNTHSVNKEDTCYWDTGEHYRGVQNVSESGRTCIRWSHQFQIHLNEHAELTGHNYCRNPGAILPRPFCYTDQNQREMCQIQSCMHILLGYIACIAIAIAVVVACIMAICCCRKRTKFARRRTLQHPAPSVDKNIYGNPTAATATTNNTLELNALLPSNIPAPQRPHNPQSGYQSLPQYTYKELNFVEELGEGAFGKVYKGELKRKSGKIYVAVKSLKENANAKTQADFQREIELISELKHANIICLLGVVMKQEPMCMLFEFMSEGDLHEFLIANSPMDTAVAGGGKGLTQQQFLHVAIQIAQGMEYLSDNHYVHRDLAARNCLVSKDLVVKISDFGLSRDMYSCDYYRVQSKSLLPVRWMPPESILYGKFTTESDVWSYGVVLWEIYSYGLQPYYGRNNQEVINMIRYRQLLPCPDACPSYCYSLMVECWAELAIRRPSFAEISHRLRVWKQNCIGGGGAASCAIYPQANRHTSTTSSKSSESSPTIIVGGGDRDVSWDKSLTKANGGRHHDSISSLTSSLGNKTISTSLSNENGSQRKSGRKMEDSLDRPKNTVVRERNGDFEIKITQ